MPTPDGRAWCVAVGEVYPSGEASGPAPASPREAILQSLAADDPARLASVNGQFAGAVLDVSKGILELACDRYALHALFWRARDGLFAFASEAKALLALPGAGRALDPQGLAAFLLLGEHFTDTTLLSDVRAAPAACRMRSGGGAPAIETWWRVRYSSSIPLERFDEAAEEAGRRFRKAVERQTAGDRRIAVPLSGGLDSRLCLAAVPADRRPRCTAFTWGDTGCLDRRFGRAAAARCGVAHRDLDYRYGALIDGAARGAWITDGLAGVADYHVLGYVDDLAARAEVVLNGYAGDAVLGGNFHWRSVRGLPLAAIARVTFAKRNDCIPADQAARFLSGAVLEAARDLPATFERAFERHAQADPLGALDAFLLDSRVRRWTSFGTQLLRSRLISRAPFYDNDFFDLVSGVPPAWRTDHGFYHRVLCAAFPEVSAVGWQTTGMPASVPPRLARPAGTLLRRGAGALERLSRGFVRSPFPVARIARAFRGRLAPRLRAALFDGPASLWDIVDRGEAERVWRELLGGSDRGAKLVGVLLTLRFFLEHRDGGAPASALAPPLVEVAPADPSWASPAS